MDTEDLGRLDVFVAGQQGYLSVNNDPFGQALLPGYTQALPAVIAALL